MTPRSTVDGPESLPEDPAFAGKVPVFAGVPPGAAFVADRLCGHVRAPNHAQRHRYPEHPAERLLLASNNLGFREDSATAIRKAPGTFRILVTGDSHTDGSVLNAESLANRLEEIIAGRPDLLPTEVINGGVGHYGPHNYVGFLEKYLPLAPDMFVVVMFAGNDFLDTVRTASMRGTVDVPPRPEGYSACLSAAERLCRPAVSQGLNQAKFFATYPALRNRTVSEAVRQLLRIQRLCAERDVDFVFVALPTKIDVDWRRDPPPVRARLLETLGLADADLEINRQLMLAVLRRLEKRGVTCLDLLDPLLIAGEQVYWNQDHHLNVRGHRVAAQAFFDRCNDRIPRR